MLAAKRGEDWTHTASLLALLANAHWGTRSKSFKPDDFNPTVERKRGAVGLDFSALKAIADRANAKG